MTEPHLTDEAAMELALAEARAALVHGDVPVGAVVLRDGVVIASRHNERELSGDPTAHAEVLAIRDAAATLGTWRLDGCTLVVTLEPCPMCAGAIWAARMDRVVFGPPDMKAGSLGSLYHFGSDPRLNHTFATRANVSPEPSAELLTSFFAECRTASK